MRKTHKLNPIYVLPLIHTMNLLLGYFVLLTDSWESQAHQWTVIISGERSVHGESYLVT